MPKGKQPIIVDGVAHRLRRGKLVPIPLEWLGGGHVTHDQTIRKRPSKQHGGKRAKKAQKHQSGYSNGIKFPSPAERTDMLDFGRSPKEEAGDGSE